MHELKAKYHTKVFNCTFAHVPASWDHPGEPGEVSGPSANFLLAPFLSTCAITVSMSLGSRQLEIFVNGNRRIQMTLFPRGLLCSPRTLNLISRVRRGRQCPSERFREGVAAARIHRKTHCGRAPTRGSSAAPSARTTRTLAQEAPNHVTLNGAASTSIFSIRTQAQSVLIRDASV